MKKLILASGSPRRKVIMEAMGLTFDIIPSQYDEHLDDSRTPQEVAVELGYGKAYDVAKDHPNAYVIGSDAIVVVDGKQLAKPADAAEAKEMLHTLSGRVHQVVTSVVLVCVKDGVRDDAVSTVFVTFKPLPEEVIDAYIATGDPYDKAGGYARQHPMLQPYVSTDGDIFAVTGLSIKELGTLLEKNSIPVPNDEKTTEKMFAEAGLAAQRIIY